jgi:5-methyltetrahydrofolate--homocysteine methyltransferase
LTSSRLRDAIARGVVVLDGAMGSALIAHGVAPDLAILDAPEAVEDLHREYVEASARVIYTCTFGANRARLASVGVERRVAEINSAAVAAARRAAGDRALVAGCIGPTGRRLAPAGDLGFEEAVALFAEQAGALLAEGVDALAIETMLDLDELGAAVAAANELRRGELVFACVSVFSGGRSIDGQDVERVAARLAAFDVDVVGANCSEGPASLLPLVEALARTTTKPILAKPNAGIPVLSEGTLIYPIGPGLMADWSARLVEAGARLAGGCCGTTPETIRAIARRAGTP